MNIISTPESAALAERIATDLRAAGYAAEPVTTVQTLERGGVTIVILTVDAEHDRNFNALLNAALDRGAHIVPVLAQKRELPDLIDHLYAVDLSDDYDFALVRQQVEAALSPDAGRPLKVRTASVRRSNRFFGLFLLSLALAMFVLGIYGVGVLGIQAPREEYDAVETEAAMTRDFLMAPELARYATLLPRNPQEAAVYAETLERVPTVYRPFMAATATAVAATATPMPTAEAEQAGE